MSLLYKLNFHGRTAADEALSLGYAQHPAQDSEIVIDRC